jgi:hypothetical protein
MDRSASPPSIVTAAWKRLIRERFRGLRAFRKETRVVQLAIELLALADEACAGAGIESASRGVDRFGFHLLRGRVLELGSTLCSDRINAEVVKVLPKQHTPGVGLTLRSLSHHLALIRGTDVLPFWQLNASKVPPNRLNILVAPWPLKLQPSQFRPRDRTGLRELPPAFGFMAFDLRDDPRAVRQYVEEVLTAAEETVGPVDLVVFPESSLAPAEFDAVRDALLARPGDPILLGGVCESARGDGYSSNRLELRSSALRLQQAKHHRWKLDQHQVVQYGLAGTLNPAMNWWEDSRLTSRQVHFVGVSSQLTLCCLICEDLARQEPVAEIVRSVGPSLVIALLMDAPQVLARWPARYASVLADDPGSSVLTVTSFGMASLSRPHDGRAPSRSVALWKDALGGSREIELPPGADAVVLSLFFERRREWTADGRDDGGVASFPRLGGVHAVARSRTGR